MIKWIRQNRLQSLALLLIFSLAIFLRFYRLPEYMTFLGDEGRDALVIKDLLVNHHYPFIGPPTSIGNIYLGPLYYYMMAIPMSIFWLDPIAAVYMVAIIGVLTIGLVYYLTKEWFGWVSASLAAFLYTISPVNVIYSRTSWNPNPAPFFALLAILGFYKAHQSGNFLWLILTGAAVAATVQMHYLALILIPTFFILWVYEFMLIRRGKFARGKFWLGTLGAVIAFWLLMSPLIVFDLRHDYLNYKAISVFFTNRETTVNVNPLNSLERIYPIYHYNLIDRYISGSGIFLNLLVSVLVLIPLVFAGWLKYKGQVLRWPYLALSSWLLVGVLGLALYKQNIYDHYLGFLNPVPFILLGSLVSLFSLVKQFENRRILVVGLILVVVGLVFVNISRSPFKNPPQNQLTKTQNVANYIIEKSNNKPFNFALIAKSNYDSAYQFYLDLYGRKPLQVQYGVAEQLFVVCEDQECQPINNPKYEIVGFGWSKVDWEETVEGVRVFKLSHNPTGQVEAK